MADITKTDHKHLVTALVEAAFLPSVPMQKCKSAFWYHWQEGISKGTPTTADIIRVTKNATISKWMTDPRFEEWFLNKKSFFERMSYIVDELAPSVIEDIILNADKPSDQLSALKLSIDVLGRMQKAKVEIQFKDDHVNKMSMDELKAFESKMLEKANGEEEESSE